MICLFFSDSQEHSWSDLCRTNKSTNICVDWSMTINIILGYVLFYLLVCSFFQVATHYRPFITSLHIPALQRYKFSQCPQSKRCWPWNYQNRSSRSYKVLEQWWGTLKIILKLLKQSLIVLACFQTLFLMAEKNLSSKKSSLQSRLRLYDVFVILGNAPCNAFAW